MEKQFPDKHELHDILLQSFEILPSSFSEIAPLISPHRWQRSQSSTYPHLRNHPHLWLAWSL